MKIRGYFEKITIFWSRLNIRSLLAFAGMAGPLVLVICDYTAAFTDPDYDLVRDSISSLALTQFGWLQTIGFLAIGLLVEIFTAGLLFSIRRARWFHLGIMLLVFFGFAMLLIGAFRTDPVGAPRTIEGRIHGIVATTAFSLFPISILMLLPSIRRDPAWRNLFWYSVTTCVLAVLFGTLLRFFHEESNWFGLLERLLVADMIIWVEVAGIKLLVLSIRHHPPRGTASA